MTRILLSGVLAAALGACVGSGEMTYGGTATYDTQPDLVAVDGDPGVQVIADYDEPVFYTDGFYWRWYNDGWYRSNVYTGGWTYWDAPPAAVVRIGRPTNYVHYRPNGYVARHPHPYRQQPIVRDNRRPEGGVEVRDHRDPYRPEGRPPADPIVRDHREPEPRPMEPRTVEPRPEPRPDVVRDHREPVMRGTPAPAPAPAPVVRDHRSPPPPPPAKKDDPHTRDHRHD